MALTRERAERRLQNYRQMAQAIAGPSYDKQRQCRVEINGRTMVVAPTWEKACDLAVAGWHAEDQARKSLPPVFALYAENGTCHFFLPGPRAGSRVVVAWGKTWDEALVMFSANDRDPMEP